MEYARCQCELLTPDPEALAHRADLVLFYLLDRDFGIFSLGGGIRS